MGVGVRQRAAIDRLEAEFRALFGAPTLAPQSEPLKQPSCPELDCLRPLLSAETIANAERRATEIGTGADRILISAGVVDEEIYVRALADALALEFETFDEVSRADCPLNDRRVIDAPATGLLPLMTASGLVFVLAPRGTSARSLCKFIVRNPHRGCRFRLTTAERLQRYVTEKAAGAIADRATNALARTWPELSAGPAKRRVSPAAIATGLAGLVSLLAAPGVFVAALEVLLSVVFLAWVALRLTGLLIERPRQPRLARLPERELPVYTIMVALYREASAVSGLAAALRRLDYPGLMAQLLALAP